MAHRDQIRITDVAEAAGVSVATVSRALRGRPNVSAATRDRVIRAAGELGYVADARASSLASGQTDVIGLVAPDFGTWYASQTLAGVEHRLAEVGYDLLVFAIERSPTRSADLRERLRRGMVDGLILVDFFLGEDPSTLVADLRLPLVTLGDHLIGVSSLTIDNYAGAVLATDHLVQLGHRHVAFVGGRSSATAEAGPADRQRLLGCADTLAMHGLPAPVEIEGGYSVDGGRRALHDALAVSPRPTAVFCASDEMALGVRAEALSHALRVPEDLSIVGFDDHEMAEIAGLTTVAQPVYSAGRLAADVLHRQVQHEAGAERVPERHELDLHLKVRESTAPAPDTGGRGSQTSS